MGFTFPVVMCGGAFAMGILMVAVISLAGWFTIDPLFTLLGCSPAERPMVRQHMHISLTGKLGLVVPFSYLGHHLYHYTGMLAGICLGQLIAGGFRAYLGIALLRPTGQTGSKAI